MVYNFANQLHFKVEHFGITFTTVLPLNVRGTFWLIWNYFYFSVIIKLPFEQISLFEIILFFI